jgi:hypothetical protein
MGEMLYQQAEPSGRRKAAWRFQRVNASSSELAGNVTLRHGASAVPHVLLLKLLRLLRRRRCE